MTEARACDRQSPNSCFMLPYYSHYLPPESRTIIRTNGTPDIWPPDDSKCMPCLCYLFFIFLMFTEVVLASIVFWQRFYRPMSETPVIEYATGRTAETIFEPASHRYFANHMEVKMCNCLSLDYFISIFDDTPCMRKSLSLLKLPNQFSPEVLPAKYVSWE